MGKIKNKIQNMPLKRTMVLFIVAALLLAGSASLITIISTLRLRTRLSGQGNYDLVDKINNIIFLLMFVYIIGFIIAAVYVFYHLKLREPIRQLLKGTEQIANNDLDFTMDYTSKDELGQVCASFEIMKTELRQSNAKMWQAAEERKKLNTVFSHDLRTPLTVLKGYTDFLEEYIPSEQMQPAKLLQTTSLMAMHIERIEHYVNMMGKIRRLEDTPVSPEPVSARTVNTLLQASINNLEKQAGISISFQVNIQMEMLHLDINIMQRVLENLLANAVRYAKHKIKVSVYDQDSYLFLAVTDDGTGFSKEYLDRPLMPFYQKDNPEHFGLGLNICKILCQNHSGSIKITNVPDGGAKILTSFKIR